MSEYLDATENMLMGRPIPGDYESLVLYGKEAQGKISEFSGNLTKIMLKDHDKLDSDIKEVLDELSYFSDITKEKKPSFSRKSKQYVSSLVSSYETLLGFLDRMTLTIKLQEAQLIKETLLLDQMDTIAADCSQEIEKCLQMGVDVLDGRRDIETVNQKHLKNTATRSDLELWYDSLSKRVDDLRMTKLVIEQLKLQTRILVNNNKQLLEKSMVLVTELAPVWRKEAELFLKLAKANANIKSSGSIQEKNQELTDAIIYLSGIEKSRSSIQSEINQFLD